ncbi:adenosine-specific kinase [Meiothermus granaticius]|uniref:Adenosine specific kinase n=1 Tax=Meiothermus granaticius NBRC 107808 TaxID=1227551 RepID=A0A399FBX3_9DEIN|nr:adenosine-specific kinase [Meiothermus granaticius]MCL6526123.1 adenosine-specific kinase [Thermaceae bacterium]RIH93663.1 Adenosine specific kinase [Meiothermus granaticius NBRC 107808]GEM86825.1 membrane protein [Meiothermus granaticius NBRC 107808]
MELQTVRVEKPDHLNVILGQAHFIKAVEDLHEALVTAVPGIQFGLAFCEASGKRLIRRSGTAPELVELAVKNAEAIGAGHSFIVMLGEGFFPINVLHAVKACPEVVRIFAATANPLSVIVAEQEDQRGILGVLDGHKPLGVETEEEVTWRKELLRRFGYKLG